MMRFRIMAVVLILLGNSACLGGKDIPISKTIVVDVSGDPQKADLLKVISDLSRSESWHFVDVSARQRQVDDSRSSIYAAVYSRDRGREFPELVVYDLNSIGHPRIMLSDGPDKGKSRHFQTSLIEEVKTRWPSARFYGPQPTGAAGGEQLQARALR